jgi:hypothetical protein
VGKPFPKIQTGNTVATAGTRLPIHSSSCRFAATIPLLMSETRVREKLFFAQPIVVSSATAAVAK